jgi:hypothetical protein
MGYAWEVYGKLRTPINRVYRAMGVSTHLMTTTLGATVRLADGTKIPRAR